MRIAPRAIAAAVAGRRDDGHARSCRSGQLLQATPIAGAPSGANAGRIRYEMRDKDRRRTESIGVLIVPAGVPPAIGRNIVAWAHGTTGIAEFCAPSLGKKALSGITAWPT